MRFSQAASSLCRHRLSLRPERQAPPCARPPVQVGIRSFFLRQSLRTCLPRQSLWRSPSAKPRGLPPPAKPREASPGKAAGAASPGQSCGSGLRRQRSASLIRWIWRAALGTPCPETAGRRGRACPRSSPRRLAPLAAAGGGGKAGFCLRSGLPAVLPAEARPKGREEARCRPGPPERLWPGLLRRFLREACGLPAAPAD
jgi:hypothetical protein